MPGEAGEVQGDGAVCADEGAVAAHRAVQGPALPAPALRLVALRAFALPPLQAAKLRSVRSGAPRDSEAEQPAAPDEGQGIEGGKVVQREEGEGGRLRWHHQNPGPGETGGG